MRFLSIFLSRHEHDSATGKFKCIFIIIIHHSCFICTAFLRELLESCLLSVKEAT